MSSQEELPPSPANTTASDDPERADLLERSNAGDAIAVVELIRRFESAVDEPPPRFAKLRLRSPSREHFPNVHRRLAKVDSKLADLFGKLAAGDAPWPLLVWGPVGTGKTLAGLSFLDLVRSGFFFTLEGLCDSVMGGRRPWQETEYDFGNLLVLDELGERSKAGDLQYTTLKGVLDHREFCFRRVAIYLSNLSPAELVTLYDDRIVSRLTAGSVFKLEGSDRRQRP